MNRAVISLGSNIEPEQNIRVCMEELRSCFGILRESECLKTKAIGPPQADFLNCAVLIETMMPQEELKKTLKELEARLGRVRPSDKFAPRTIDLDILTWNGRVVDPDVADREFLRVLIDQVVEDPRDAGADQDHF